MANASRWPIRPPPRCKKKLGALALSVLFLCFGPSSAQEDSVQEDSPSPLKLRTVYTNTWAVLINGSSADADRIASRNGYQNLGPIIPDSGYFLFSNPRLKQRSRRKRSSAWDLSKEPQVQWLSQQSTRRRVKRAFRAYRSIPNDPEWNAMWYLNRPGMDMGVQQAWEMGMTGKGVVVTILDDGLETDHPDLEENYDKLASYDINDQDEDPTPRYSISNDNRHGTRCAGEVAAAYNNNVCVVGIAYRARIGGIRMLDGDVTDAVEAFSLSYNKNHIDIYSASWGPDDDGRTVEGPARLARAAFDDGIRLGRHGKGSIFVWASGNGGREADSCNCDGYTNSIYTLSIASATEHGNVPWYSEACSSTLAATYSSGASGERMIATTDLEQKCTDAHTGTSASAPIAAAICALALEANPNLTWRDLQHIVVRTARPQGLRTTDWNINGAGKNVSHAFGYGLMDAGAMVRMARNWTRVPEQKRCMVPYRSHGSGYLPQTLRIPQHTKLQVVLKTSACAGNHRHEVRYLEHVQARITLTAPKRGNIQIFLVSPAGTKSTLLAKRQRDNSRAGFREWAFMTTHSWGESAAGTWTLEIQNDGFSSANLIGWDLVLYGTVNEVGAMGGTAAQNSPPLFPAYYATGSTARACLIWTIVAAWYFALHLLL